jgi:hypothetical protein
MAPLRILITDQQRTAKNANSISIPPRQHGNAHHIGKDV